jgi:hypothetical protein
MADGVSRISTHVLDTALGVPAVGVPVCLEQQESGTLSISVQHGCVFLEPKCTGLVPGGGNRV